MCKEMPFIPVNMVVDKKLICNWKNGKKSKEEERHKGSLTPQK
jgi:hypothetical protein